jgi:phage terminase large subunit
VPLDSGGTRPEFVLDIPAKAIPIMSPYRYKVLYGGRGGTKSHTIARGLLAQSMAKRLRILCTREFQTSIADSVHRILSDQIYLLGLTDYFDIQARTIFNRKTGSQFIFKGLHHHIQEIKSIEGVDRCWVEEAQAVSEESWQVLEPTIFRNPGAEIWISFNPYKDDDPTYVRFVLQNPLNCFRLKLSWADNPWLSKEMNELRLFTLQKDPDAYDWIWEGHTRKISEATIFRNSFVVEPFEEPEVVDRYFYGADWGFSVDPTALIRSFIHEDVLYITHEAYAVGVELDDLPALFAGGVAEKNGVEYPGIPGVKDWPIYGDNARPETISYVRRRGFNIEPADKWKGCVEDGIEHLKGFRKIVIHPRCTNTAQEFRLYSYKTDPKTEQVLPVIVDKWNHSIDAIRYSLNGYIQARGGLGVWERLAS